MDAAKTLAEIAALETLACEIAASEPCPRCKGAGKLHALEHILNGVCFRCKGRGVRTARTYAKVLRAQEKAAQLREEVESAYQAEVERYHAWQARFEEINSILLGDDDDGLFCLFGSSEEHPEARPLTEIELGPEPAEPPSFSPLEAA